MIKNTQPISKAKNKLNLSVNVNYPEQIVEELESTKGEEDTVKRKSFVGGDGRNGCGEVKKDDIINNKENIKVTTPLKVLQYDGVTPTLL